MNQVTLLQVVHSLLRRVRMFLNSKYVHRCQWMLCASNQYFQTQHFQNCSFVVLQKKCSEFIYKNVVEAVAGVYLFIHNIQHIHMYLCAYLYVQGLCKIYALPFKMLRSLRFFLKEFILLFSMDASKWCEMTVKTFIMLQKFSISNKCFLGTADFNIYSNNNVSWAVNKHISEGSWLSMGLKIQLAEINYNKKNFFTVLLFFIVFLIK